MATFNSVFAPTRFASVLNAQKSDPQSVFQNYNGKIYKEIWSGATRGKIKDFICKHAFASNSFGTDFNGYGWANLHNHYYLSLSDSKALLELVLNKNIKREKTKSQEQKRDAWAKRLVNCLAEDEKYAWVTFDVAKEIAEEKEEYKEMQILKMNDRQSERFSVRRETLIRKMERENPLRRIEGHDHAVAIILASKRHNNSNYEFLLEEYREEAKWGFIDYDDVKPLARKNMIEE